MATESATFAEFARLLGIKPQAVTALRQAGRLALTDDGKRVLVAESQQRLRDTADPSKAGVVARHAAERAARAVEDAASVDGGEDGLGDAEQGEDATVIAGYQPSRARREHYLALTAQMEYELRIGKLMDATEVTAAASSAAATLRASLERLSDVLAPQLAAVNDEGQVRAMLAEAIEHALDETARQFTALSRQAAA